MGRLLLVACLGTLVASSACAATASDYRAAATRGNAAAQCALGVCYETGTGVPQDATEAAKWCCLVADQGDRSTQGS